MSGTRPARQRRPRSIGLETLQSSLDYRFAEPALLELALTHRSYAFEAGGLPTNERLEFLGDAVLGMVVADRVYHLFPEYREGRLAKLRAAAVNTHSLAELARGLQLGEQVRLGRGEELSGGRDKDSILADTLEAVLGAAYLDGGIEEAAGLVGRLLGELLEDLASRKESLDYKTSLQEFTAAALSTTPFYGVSESGPDHQKRFRAWVQVSGEHLGSGEGRSKKEAEQAAARQAYRELRRREIEP